MGRRSASPRRSRSPAPRRAHSRSRSRGSPRLGDKRSARERSRSRSRGDRRVASRGRSRSRERGRGRDGDRDRDRGRVRDRSRDRGAARPQPMSLLVRNLAPTITQEELRRAFSRRPGDILDVYIPKEYNSTRPRGFAFIEFADGRDGREVKFEMDRTQLNGREIAVLFAKQHRKSPTEMRRILNVTTAGSLYLIACVYNPTAHAAAALESSDDHLHLVLRLRPVVLRLHLVVPRLLPAVIRLRPVGKSWAARAACPCRVVLLTLCFGFLFRPAEFTSSERSSAERSPSSGYESLAFLTVIVQIVPTVCGCWEEVY
ncbi:hypothetical protein BBJ28_00017494 [Nothophytophthora sp. Chile5]|nr:hypothetical protein BBJ28_00017494 [Nothophytophthora sp. Chile5]